MYNEQTDWGRSKSVSQQNKAQDLLYWWLPLACQIIKLLGEHRRTLWPWLTFMVGDVVQWEVPALHDKVLGLKLQLQNSNVLRNKWA